MAIHGTCASSLPAASTSGQTFQILGSSVKPGPFCDVSDLPKSLCLLNIQGGTDLQTQPGTEVQLYCTNAGLDLSFVVSSFAVSVL